MRFAQPEVFWLLLLLPLLLCLLWLRTRRLTAFVCRLGTPRCCGRPPRAFPYSSVRGGVLLWCSCHFSAL
jgi:hypothetical protein